MFSHSETRRGPSAARLSATYEGIWGHKEAGLPLWDLRQEARGGDWQVERWEHLRLKET